MSYNIHMQSKYLGKLVHVSWLDATSENGWHKDAPNMDCWECESVGFVVKHTRRRLVLCSTIGEGQSGQTIVLPIGMIKRIRKLKVR